VSDIDRERLRAIRTFPSLVAYLRDELDWPIESEDFDDLTFDYEPEELGLDPGIAAKIEEIKQLRPLASNQPWGIFFIKFEPKRLPVVVLRRILGQLVFKKRASAKRSEQASWQLNDLLFISAYGEGEQRQINLAHFAESRESGALPTLKVLGWDDADRDLKIDYIRHEMQAKLRWPEDPSDLDSWHATWASVFTLRHREVITTSKMLAEQLAELATAVRDRVNKVLSLEHENGPLRRLLKAFREALVHDLTEDGFADIYAQTISYGLLSERLMPKRDGREPLGLGSLKVMNPFLGELLDDCRKVGRKRGLIDFDELGVGEVEDLLKDPNTKYHDILRDFDNRNPAEDPVIHFYEHFLREYDPKQRIQRGVFYTPKPVVSFIVRSVDEILRTEFGLSDGLADTTTWGDMLKRHPDMKLPEHTSVSDPFVQILDPAAGTGTFLVEVIDVAHKTMTAKWGEQGHMPLEFNKLWNEYVSKDLLPRLYGFELMMAPYAIAHMKIGLKLLETGYQFQSDQCAQVFLTNSLEPAQDFSGIFEQMAPILAHEARSANKVKAQVPVTVIVGNPPYASSSANQGTWITDLLKTRLAEMPEAGHYYEVDGTPLSDLGEQNTRFLLDDYVKFLRYGQYRIAHSRCGVLGFITNHGYLDNPTFSGLRQSMLVTFPYVDAFDLHGSLIKHETPPDGNVDENVFAIRPGVSIGLFQRPPTIYHKAGYRVRYSDIWGTQDRKFLHLINNDRHSVTWTTIDFTAPQFRFVIDRTGTLPEYNAAWEIRKVMPHYANCVITKRDTFVVDFDREPLVSRICEFFSSNVPDSTLRARYGLESTYEWDLPSARGGGCYDPERLIQYLYRPFDRRILYYDERLIARPTRKIVNHVSPTNPMLIVGRSGAATGGNWSLAYVTTSAVDWNIYRRGGGTTFPTKLMEYGSGTLIGRNQWVPNVAIDFRNAVKSCLQLSWLDDGCGNLLSGGTVGPIDVLHYIYSQFHSQTYRDRYSEFLKKDFPRFFLTENLNLFRALCQLGADLVALHLLQNDYTAASWNQQEDEKGPLTRPISKFISGGSTDVDKGYPKCRDSKVFINADSYFDSVPGVVWNFHIGGYQVCEKWLKDRGPKKGKPGRVLGEEDIAHYQKIVVALNETICLMREIDKVIEEHGGWPSAFVTG